MPLSRPPQVGRFKRLVRRFLQSLEPKVEGFDNVEQAIERALEVRDAILVVKRRPSPLPIYCTKGRKEYHASEEAGKEQKPPEPEVPGR